jgi:hypothetical protein
LAAGEFNANNWDNEYRNSIVVKAFLIMRPMVEKAGEYHTVLEMIRRYPAETLALIADPDSEEKYSFFEEKFKEIKAEPENDEIRYKFGDNKDSNLFNNERKRLIAEDINGWYDSQQPFEQTIPQFRYLVQTQKRDDSAGNAYDAVVSGFAPWFATSKDDASAHALCVFYANVMKLDPDVDIGNGRRVCMIPRERIIGKERTTNKIEQMKEIARLEDIPYSQVWRLNDRYDPKQQIELYRVGFTNQFFLPGYATKHEIERSKSDPFVRLLDKERFAEQLGEFAEQWRF